MSFDTKKGSLRFPCDTYISWEDNLRAIVLTLERLRAIDRYGVTQHAEQYKGWNALPDNRTPDIKRNEALEWLRQKMRDVVGVADASQYDVESMRRKLVVILHPDRRGSDVEFKQLMAMLKVLEQA